MGVEAVAEQRSSTTSAVETKISPAAAAPHVSACRNETVNQAAPAKGLYSVQWDKTAQPEVTKSRIGTRVIMHVSVAGRARSSDGWVPLTAQCEFDRGRLAAVALDLAPALPPGVGLNLSGITPPPEVPTGSEAPSSPGSPWSPRTDPPETSGSSTIVPTLRETRPDLPPTINKRQKARFSARSPVRLQIADAVLTARVAADPKRAPARMAAGHVLIAEKLMANLESKLAAFIKSRG
jgi:hypothetical protein